MLLRLPSADAAMAIDIRLVEPGGEVATGNPLPLVPGPAEPDGDVDPVSTSELG